MKYSPDFIHQFTHDIVLEIRAAFRHRFAAESRGIFIHLPFTSRSMRVEWREQSVGLGLERADAKAIEFFAGRIHGVLSVEGGR